MERKELMQKLIEAYRDLIKNLPQNNWESYLYDNNASYGICYYSLSNFGISLAFVPWVDKYKQSKEIDSYWFTPPGNAKDRKECIRCLRIRLLYLKLELFEQFGCYHPKQN